MPVRVIKPKSAVRRDIRCNVADAIVANLAAHIVFFFERPLDAAALQDAFARALESFPIFAGRLGLAGGRMRIRCDGQGVPFSTAASGRTLADAVRSVEQDAGDWLVDPVNGPVARWGLGPLCTVRITQLAGDATAIALSWHHVIGDMQTAMQLMNGWADAAAGRPVAEPLIVDDRAAYLDGRLPADGAERAGVRTLRTGELVRSVVFLARDARWQRTLNLDFGDDEIARMRDAYEDRNRLSANDVVCAHICEAIMAADPAVERRALAIAVNVRGRCGLDPRLAGNMITTLTVDLNRGEPAGRTAGRIRRAVDHFADEYCDMRINQRFLDSCGPWRAARCVSTAFNPVCWNPIITNWSGFGVYRVRFEDTFPCYFAPLMRLPVTGLGALIEGADGTGLVFRMSMPPKEFDAMTRPPIAERLRRFRCG